MTSVERGHSTHRHARTRGDPGVSVSSARVIVTPVSPPLIHPLSKRDVQRVLSVLPADSLAGLRSVSLLGDQLTAAGDPVLASYRREGFIRLHAVTSLPWRVGHLPPRHVADLARYGASVESGKETVVRWTPDSLRLFYTVGVLLPGVARHRREHEGAEEGSPIVRALDDQADVWQVSDMALDQWRRFLVTEGH